MPTATELGAARRRLLVGGGLAAALAWSGATQGARAAAGTTARTAGRPWDLALAFDRLPGAPDPPAGMGATSADTLSKPLPTSPHRLARWRLDPRAGAVQTLATLALPTRAHGLAVDAQASLLAVARRPGDWLLRWSGRGDAAQWHWAEPGRSFNGHVLPSPDGRFLLCTETELDSGAGRIGLRDAATLALLDDWPSHGLDPHQLLWDPRAPGQLLVANGGIATRPESGRQKLDLAQMDSSLVRLDGCSGRLLGQWRLPDPRLSLRHLAWSADGATLGVALQAEHDELGCRQAAPVLALFDGRRLQAMPAPQPLAGYGGDIAGWAGGFAVSCPRRGGLAWFDAQGAWRGFQPLAQACALWGQGERLWAGGAAQATGWHGPASAAEDAAGGRRTAALALPPGARLDNHWVAWPVGAA